MSVVGEGVFGAPAGERPVQKPVSAAPYVATVFLSAAMVFLVQPMFAKMALPLLGGSPSVWNVSLVCFQAALLAGYAYAHLLARIPRVGVQVGVHAVLLLLAAACLPLSISGLFGQPDTTRPTLWLVATFAVSIAPPFAVISATAPLIQSWYARSGRHDAADPYHLYAASNAGSLIGLAAYPLLMEPFTRLGTQTQLWTGGYVLLAVLLIASGLVSLRGRADAPQAVAAETATPEGNIWRQRLTWLMLAAVPSGLLVAATSHISTDVAAAPFLWAPPLMAYIATFIIVFSSKPAIRHSSALRLMPYAVAAAAFMVGYPGASPFPLWLSLVGHVLALFVVALALHGELAARRPDASRLTEYYLIMSAGGVVGSAFCGLLAPVIFSSIYEYPVLLLAAILLYPAKDGWKTGLSRDRVLAGALFAFAAAAILAYAGGVQVHSKAYQVALLLLVVISIVFASRRLVPVAALAAAFVIGATALPDALISTERGFFGVVRVIDSKDADLRLMVHGTTKHGAQRLSTTGRPVPRSYYYSDAPIGQVFSAMAPDVRTVGVVGLGVGSVACYRQDSQAYTFFEIDPIVVKTAADPARFTFLSECAPEERIVLGDARITLGAEPAGGFDLLLLDAFSSDTVPAHLLTREAMALYLSRLSEDGVLVFHISNRHMDLAPVVARIGAAEGATMLVQTYDAGPPEQRLETGADSSQVVILAKSPGALARFAADPRWHALAADGQRPWTDDYTNIVGTLITSYRSRAGTH
ncbi:MAG: fused MFS/spermidine synthase [Hyphomonas sp.]|uniref:spermidine synthase n=1 Tax=Hyphomonas sp. TaxID=87 RepID=UPI0035272B06